MPRRAMIGLGMMASAATMLAIISMPPAQQQLAMISAGGIVIAAGLWRFRHRFRTANSPVPVHHDETLPPPVTPAGFDPAVFMKAATTSAGPASSTRTLPALTDERLPKLRALQAHPETPAHERTAAEDVIERLSKTKRRKARRAP
jgi:hypothetical protein